MMNPAIFGILQSMMELGPKVDQVIQGPSSSGAYQAGLGSAGQDQGMLGGLMGGGMMGGRPSNPQADLMAALLGQDNTEALAKASMQYDDTQNRRFGNTIAGGIEGVVDAFRAGGKQDELAAQMGQAAQNKMAMAQAEKQREIDLENERRDNIYKSVRTAVEKQTGNIEQAHQLAIAAVENPELAENIMGRVGEQVMPDSHTIPAAVAAAKEMGLDPQSPEGKKFIEEVMISKANQHNYAPQPPTNYWWADPQAAAGGDYSSGMDPLPGSPAAREIQQEEQKANQVRFDNISLSGNVQKQIKDVRDLLKSDMDKALNVGVAADAITKLPLSDWTEAGAIKQHIETIVSNVSMDRLERMRQNSPTGGALGNVSNFEVEQLQKNTSPLKQGMNYGQFEDSLSDIERSYQRLEFLSRHEAELREIAEQQGPEAIVSILDERFGGFTNEQRAELYRTDEELQEILRRGDEQNQSRWNEENPRVDPGQTSSIPTSEEEIQQMLRQRSQQNSRPGSFMDWRNSLKGN